MTGFPRIRQTVGRGVAAAIVLAFVVSATPAAAEDLAARLKASGLKIVYESFREGNWELCQIGLDGPKPVNLTFLT